MVHILQRALSTQAARCISIAMTCVLMWHHMDLASAAQAAQIPSQHPFSFLSTRSAINVIATVEAQLLFLIFTLLFHVSLQCHKVMYIYYLHAFVYTCVMYGNLYI